MPDTFANALVGDVFACEIMGEVVLYTVTKVTAKYVEAQTKDFPSSRPTRFRKSNGMSQGGSNIQLLPLTDALQARADRFLGRLLATKLAPKLPGLPLETLP